jgi:hypothetical protein
MSNIFHRWKDIKRIRNGETVYLEGVSTWHEREQNDVLNKEQKRF